MSTYSKDFIFQNYNVLSISWIQWLIVAEGVNHIKQMMSSCLLNPCFLILNWGCCCTRHTCRRTHTWLCVCVLETATLSEEHYSMLDIILVERKTVYTFWNCKWFPIQSS